MTQHWYLDSDEAGWEYTRCHQGIGNVEPHFGIQKYAIKGLKPRNKARKSYIFANLEMFGLNS